MRELEEGQSCVISFSNDNRRLDVYDKKEFYHNVVTTCGPRSIVEDLERDS